jgi:hypothetical protein
MPRPAAGRQLPGPLQGQRARRAAPGG